MQTKNIRHAEQGRRTNRVTEMTTLLLPLLPFEGPHKVRAHYSTVGEAGQEARHSITKCNGHIANLHFSPYPVIRMIRPTEAQLLRETLKGE